MSDAKTLEERAKAMVASWEHGDEQHRQWLRDTAVPQILTALREVREEALEEAAHSAMGVFINKRTIANRIRKLKERP